MMVQGAQSSGGLIWLDGGDGTFKLNRPEVLHFVHRREAGGGKHTAGGSNSVGGNGAGGGAVMVIYIQALYPILVQPEPQIQDGGGGGENWSILEQWSWW